MITVCMATYNGEDFVIRQMDTILHQLGEKDEVIVVDDCSTDKTVELISEKYGDRVNVLVNSENIGAMKSFEKAISLANGDIIFLCDQDDIWNDNKVFSVINVFKSTQATLVTHDATVVDGDLQIIADSWNTYNNNRKQGIIGNVIKNGFTGACMAFSRDIVSSIIPFPANIEMHDQWIALVCMMDDRKIVYIDEPLMQYVRHGSNVTGMSKRSIVQQLKGRLGTISAIKQYRKRKS